MAEITLERVTKIYPGGVRAVSEFDLRVAAGELLVLVGPSGCGKTTTLRLIAGLDEPTGGTIRIDGRDMASVPPRERGVGMVFQRPALYPHLTVRENLGFTLKLARMPRSQRDLQVRETARQLELDDVLDRYPAQLSGGQQQRVALGRALAHRPRILLLDEPLSNLDMRLRVELRRHLHLLHRRLPATMLHVTHDPLEAILHGERIAVLHEGRLQQVGQPAELYERPANRFVAGFIGWPAMNFLDGNLVKDNEVLWFATGDWKLPIPAAPALRWAKYSGQRVMLGIRPEDVILQGDATSASLSVELEVELVEPLGRQSLISLKKNGIQLSVFSSQNVCQSASISSKIQVGERIRVVLMLERSHLFDAHTGVALGRGILEC